MLFITLYCSLLYIFIFEIYSKFAWKNNFLALGVCFLHLCWSAGCRFAVSRSHVQNYRRIFYLWVSKRREYWRFARVNQVISASLRYPLSVFNKNSTLKEAPTCAVFVHAPVTNGFGEERSGVQPMSFIYFVKGYGDWVFVIVDWVFWVNVNDCSFLGDCWDEAQWCTWNRLFYSQNRDGYGVTVVEGDKEGVKWVCGGGGGEVSYLGGRAQHQKTSWHCCVQIFEVAAARPWSWAGIPPPIVVAWWRGHLSFWVWG